MGNGRSRYEDSVCVRIAASSGAFFLTKMGYILLDDSEGDAFSLLPSEFNHLCPVLLGDSIGAI
jgi:hypothetical protein